MYDELALDTLGDKKTALFLIMSDTDSTFNFLISMVYTQLFNLLCDKADDVYGGKLPIHVRCLIDECANIGQIPNLEKLVATIRSREISACLVLQARSQLKAIYVCWVYNQNGYDVGRTTANGLWNKSQHISESEAKPGDLVFFEGTYDTPGKSHVGIYLGNGMMVSAGDPIKYANIHSSYWEKHLAGFGRLSK